MKSIRFFLIAVLFSVIAVVIFIAMLAGYQRSLQQSEMLLDKELHEKYRLLDQVLSHFRESTINNGVAKYSPLIDSLDSSQAIYQIIDENNRIVLQSEEAGSQPLTELVEGVGSFNHRQYRWHAYVKHASDLPYWIIVAERDDARFSLVDAIIVDILKPILMGLLAIVVLGWLVVRAGFKPVAQLAKIIHEKSASDLTPISSENIPDELQAITSSVNDLFNRLTTSFEREKRFTADAAHEMRNPITALKIHIDNLLEDIPEKSEALLKIKQAIDRLSNLVEQMLVLHRMSPDQYMANFSDMDLQRVAKEVIAELYGEIEKKSQTIELDAQSCHLYADLFGIEILIKNLIDNASKYSPKNGVIRVRITPETSGSIKGFLLSIEDSGPGIPAAERQRVFDRFYRVGGDRHSSKIVGSGLGLSIVKHITELHGATLNLKASDLGGLCVEIFFPANPAKKP